MESTIKIRATVPEMNAFFEEDGGVRYMEIRDKRYTEAQLKAMPEEQYNSTKFMFYVVYRHKELETCLSGTFTIQGLRKKLRDTKGIYDKSQREENANVYTRDAEPALDALGMTFEELAQDDRLVHAFHKACRQEAEWYDTHC